MALLTPPSILLKGRPGSLSLSNCLTRPLVSQIACGGDRDAGHQTSRVDDVKKHVRRAAETVFSLVDLPLMLEALICLAEVALAASRKADAPAKPAKPSAERATQDAVGLSQAYWREAWLLFGHMHLRNTDIALRARAPIATLERVAAQAERLVRLLLLYGGVFAADNLLAFEVRVRVRVSVRACPHGAQTHKGQGRVCAHGRGRVR